MAATAWETVENVRMHYLGGDDDRVVAEFATPAVLIGHRDAEFYVGRPRWEFPLRAEIPTAVTGDLAATQVTSGEVPVTPGGRTARFVRQDDVQFPGEPPELGVWDVHLISIDLSKPGPRPFNRTAWGLFEDEIRAEISENGEWWLIIHSNFSTSPLE